jgi:hypothetical protein
MAESDDILQRIALLGADDIRKELNQLGADGEAALKKLEQAGGGDLAKGVRALMPEVAKFNSGLEGAAVSAGKLPGIFGKIQSALRGLGNASGLGSFKTDAEKATAAANVFGGAMREAGRDVRLLGRITQLADLTGFGRVLQLAGKNASLLILPGVVAGVERLAASAAHAASGFADMAVAAQQTPANFGKFAAVVIALGGSFDDAGKAAKTFETNIATALASTQQAAEGVVTARAALDNTTTGFVETTRGLDTVRQQAQAANLQFVRTGGTLEQFNQIQRQTAQATFNVQQQMLKAGDAVEAAQKALDKARSATTPLEDAFRKVGVTLTTSFQKLPIAEQLARMADGFKNLPPDVDKTKLAVQLLGEEMGRKFVRALAGGQQSLKDFIAEGERIRPTFNDGQIAIGDDMVQASGKLTSALASLKDAFGLATAPIFTDFFKKVADLVVQARPSIESFGRAIGTVLTPFLNGAVIVLQLIGQVITLLAPLFEKIAELINKAFGTNITGVQLFAAIFIGLIAAIAPTIPLILLVAAAVGILIKKLAEIDWAGFTKPAVDFWNSLTKFANDTAISISNAFNIAINFVKGLWNDLKATISGWATSVSNFISGVIDKVKALASALAGIGGGSSDASAVANGTAPAMAGGGSVRGAGTARSDSIWARLSNGEFVIQAAAVKKYGTQFLGAVNSMRFNSRNFPGFNMGGLVDALAPMRAIPAYASGGAVAAGGPDSIINLTIGQESFFGLRAPEDTAAKLTKFARRKGVRSAGRKPAWVGG